MNKSIDPGYNFLLLTSTGGRLFNPTIPEYVVTRHLIEQGHTISFLMPSRGPLSEALEGLGARVVIQPFLASPRKLSSRLKLFFLKYQLTKAWQGVDLVLAMRTSSAYIAVPLAHKLRVPVVSYLHGHTGNASKFNRYRIDQSDAVLAVSQASLSCYLPTGKYFSEQLCQVIYNGINAEAFVLRSQGRDARADLGINPEAHVVGMAGAYYGKGMDVFVKAAPFIKKAVPDVHFIVAGEFRSHEFEKEMINQIEIMGLRGSFHCVGQMTEIAPIISACTLWTMPTRVDAFPMIGLEAMALSKPIVANAVGGIPEMVGHEMNGILVEVGDVESFVRAVLRLLTNADLRRKFQDSAQQRVSDEFNLTTQMNLLEQVLKKVIVRGPLLRP